MVDNNSIGGMTPFEFTSLGEICHARYLRVSEDAPLLLIATGGSNRGSLSPSWQHLPSIYAHHGISTMIFDFAGQGNSGGNRRYLTIKKGVQNLKDVLDVILKWDWIQENSLAIMGSSYGGNVLLDYLASDEAKNVVGAVFKSPCIDLAESYLQELGDDGMKKWEQDGYSELTYLDWQVIKEANNSDLSQRLHKITVPLLITHGVADESVPISQSRFVRDNVVGIVDLVEMNGANHHYSDRDDWDRMMALHVGWLKHMFFDIRSSLK